MGVAGLGIGFTFAAMPGFIIRAVPASETGSATGFYQVLRNIGLSVGSALGAAILLSFTHKGAIYPEVGGFRTSLLVSAALGVTTAIASFVLPGQVRDRRRGEDLEHEIVLLGVEEGELAGAGAMFDRDAAATEEGT